MNLGFIGLGVMGRPMAGHLQAAGHALFLHSRSGVPAGLLEAGGTACASGAEVARQSDVVFTMLPDTPDVEAVLFGPGGVASGLRRGQVVVDMSSISPVETKRFAARIEALGADYLDAPVSGGDVGARNATLSIMAGGLQVAGHGTAHDAEPDESEVHDDAFLASWSQPSPARVPARGLYSQPIQPA